MAGFEPRKEFQPQAPAPAGPGVPLSQNPLVRGVRQAVTAMPPAVTAPQGVYARQQLPPAGLPLGASAGGKPLTTPEVPKTAQEQQATAIQQRSQSTPAAQVGAAPGKTPENPATPNQGPVTAPAAPQRYGIGHNTAGVGVVQGADGRSIQVDPTGRMTAFGVNGQARDLGAVSTVNPADQAAAMKRLEEYKRLNALDRMQDDYRENMRMASRQREADMANAWLDTGGSMLKNRSAGDQAASLLEREARMKGAESGYTSNVAAAGSIYDKRMGEFGVNQQARMTADAAQATAAVAQGNKEREFAQKDRELGIQETTAKANAADKGAYEGEVPMTDANGNPIRQKNGSYQTRKVRINPKDPKSVDAVRQGIIPMVTAEVDRANDPGLLGRGIQAVFGGGVSPEARDQQINSMADQRMAEYFGVGAQPQQGGMKEVMPGVFQDAMGQLYKVQ